MYRTSKSQISIGTYTQFENVQGMPGETENKEKAEARTGDTEDNKKPAEDDANVSKGDDDADKTHDPYYPPVITLPEVCACH